MKRMSPTGRTRKAFRGRSHGFTLIEVLVALALFAIIGIVFAGGLATASRAVFTGDVRTNAESLARTQMEYVKSHGYDSAGNYTPQVPPQYENTGYSATIAALELETGLQEITVTVSHEGRQVITLVGYKVNRG
jgi:prepilin-type N-terminal cleavage/methylation domain-containing protein